MWHTSVWTVGMGVARVGMVWDAPEVNSRVEKAFVIVVMEASESKRICPWATRVTSLLSVVYVFIHLSTGWLFSLWYDWFDISKY